jgi:Lrp/AsnC family transcriptional regulator, cysteine-sensing transcriptional activator
MADWRPGRRWYEAGFAAQGAVEGKFSSPARTMKMDTIDRKILDLLQHDATLSIAEIGSRVGLSQTPCWKRIQKLEAEGVIERRVALLNPEKLGLGLTVFVSIETADHSREWLSGFAEFVAKMPEVLEFYRMAGDVDYMLRVVVPSMAAYDDFYKRLIATIPLKNVTSRFAMERVKATTLLPIALGETGRPV